MIFVRLHQSGLWYCFLSNSHCELSKSYLCNGPFHFINHAHLHLFKVQIYSLILITKILSKCFSIPTIVLPYDPKSPQSLTSKLAQIFSAIRTASLPSSPLTSPGTFTVTTKSVPFSFNRTSVTSTPNANQPLAG
jgi:hypothetical protein